MAIFDIIIVLTFLIVIVFGYRYGVFKMISDVITLFIGSILSKLISNILFNLLYQYLPFFNFFGKSKGLKSINIIVWQLIIYAIVLLIIIAIINKILKKTKLKQKISDSMIEANLISKLLGVIVSILLSFVITFNAIVFLLTPCFNLTIVTESRFVTIIMENMPILSSQNKAIYKSEIYTIERINRKDNTAAKYKKASMINMRNGSAFLIMPFTTFITFLKKYFKYFIFIPQKMIYKKIIYKFEENKLPEPKILNLINLLDLFEKDVLQFIEDLFNLRAFQNINFIEDDFSSDLSNLESWLKK